MCNQNQKTIDPLSAREEVFFLLLLLLLSITLRYEFSILPCRGSECVSSPSLKIHEALDGLSALIPTVEHLSLFILFHNVNSSSEEHLWLWSNHWDCNLWPSLSSQISVAYFSRVSNHCCFPRIGIRSCKTIASATSSDVTLIFNKAVRIGPLHHSICIVLLTRLFRSHLFSIHYTSTHTP